MRSALFLLTLSLALMPGAQASGPYQITHTYTLGGDGSWDYIVPDPPQHRLFIGRQNRVMVVDENDGKLLGEVTGIDGAHGTALADRSGHGFATSGNDGAIVMFDLKTFKGLSRTPAAQDADAIVYDAPSNRVFSLNGDAHSSTVVDANTGQLVTNIPLGGKPEYGASAGDGNVYANLTDISEVVEIDAKALKVTRRWSTAPCQQPVAMALDIPHHRVFSGCRSGTLAVSDSQSGKVVATVPIGAGVDGVGFDPKSADVFAANADGTLTIVHQDGPDAYHVLQTLTTPQGSRNLGLDPVTHRVFIVSATFGPAPAGGRGRGPVQPGSFKLIVIEHQVSAKPAKVALPAPVDAAFKKAYPNATIKNVSKETENGKVQYEIESMDGTQARDLVYRPDGTLVLYEELIAQSDVPAAVLTAIKTKYPKSTVSRSEKLFQDGKMNYELVLAGAAVKEVILTPEGKWVSPAK